MFGLGYVGTVTAACLATNGFDVWGVDVDSAKVAMVAGGNSTVAEPGLDDLVSHCVAEGRLHATTSLVEALERSDASLICVGTPSTNQGAANLSFVARVVDDIAEALAAGEDSASNGHVVIVRSTVPPGTVEQLQSRLNSGTLADRRQLGMAMCPEFLREGTGIADFYSPPYTVIGCDAPWVAERVERLFSFVKRPVRVVDTRTAEALKYASNAFHATKVSFANELGRLLRHLGVDSRAVMELFCEDSQLNISARYLRPGFAFGGSCLPKDLRSLVHLGRMEGLDLPLLAGTLSSNRLSLTDVVDRVVTGEGRSVALLGLSFKPGSDDLRESPYVDLAETLLGKGYKTRIYDPMIRPSGLVGANRQYVESRLPHLQRVLTRTAEDALQEADIAIVSLATPEVVRALLTGAPPRLIDLNGRLGEAVESLPGYEGVSW